MAYARTMSDSVLIIAMLLREPLIHKTNAHVFRSYPARNPEPLTRILNMSLFRIASSLYSHDVSQYGALTPP